MGADSTLVFDGVRDTVTRREIEPPELDRDPRPLTARRHRLESR